MTEECAKVVGVDSEYLSKVEEQKKKREELVRKKEQRRYGGGEEDKTKEKVKPVEDDYNKKKAYLCVTIRNMSRLENAPDRIEKLATEMGAITVSFVVSEIIFFFRNVGALLMIKLISYSKITAMQKASYSSTTTRYFLVFVCRSVSRRPSLTFPR